MSKEEIIKEEIINKFNYLEGKITIQRERRINLEVPLENFMEIFDYIVTKMNFSVLSTITGLDEGENLGYIYHISQDNKILINLKTSVNKQNPVIKTITQYFPAADLYERELADLLGTKIEGLPEGRRYPLPEDWPEGQYPLRKDWKADFSGIDSKESKEVK